MGEKIELVSVTFELQEVLPEHEIDALKRTQLYEILDALAEKYGLEMYQISTVKHVLHVRVLASESAMLTFQEHVRYGELEAWK